MSTQIIGRSPTLSIQQFDGSWIDVSDSVSQSVITFESDLHYPRTPIKLPSNWEIELPARMIHPRRSIDILVILYECITNTRCPGSWATKRLTKKRMKAINSLLGVPATVS